MRGVYPLVDLQIDNDALRLELAAFFSTQTAYRLQKTEDSELPDLVIIEMGESWDKALLRIQAIRNMSPTSEIFLTAAHTDTSILLCALRTGVQEFLPQPLQKEDLHDALQRFEARYQNHRQQSTRRSKLINVLGSKGGVGTTTVAVNLAVSLQEIHPNSSVVLVDLNVPFGDVALYLDIEPIHTFGDIASDPFRLDETFLTSLLSRHPSGLYLLPSADRMIESSTQMPDCVEQSLELLQGMFDYVVLDSGDAFDDITVTTLKQPSTLFLISTLTLPVMRNTKRLVTFLSDLDFSMESIKIIVNRYQSKYELSLHDFEKTLRQIPFWTIPNDYPKVSNSINQGRSLSDIYSRAKITKSVRNLAITLFKEEKKYSLFSQALHVFRS